MSHKPIWKPRSIGGPHRTVTIFEVYTSHSPLSFSENRPSPCLCCLVNVEGTLRASLASRIPLVSVAMTGFLILVNRKSPPTVSTHSIELNISSLSGLVIQYQIATNRLGRHRLSSCSTLVWVWVCNQDDSLTGELTGGLSDNRHPAHGTPALVDESSARPVIPATSAHKPRISH